VQVERYTKKKLAYFFISETQPTFIPLIKVVQVEQNTK